MENLWTSVDLHKQLIRNLEEAGFSQDGAIKLIKVQNTAPRWFKKDLSLVNTPNVRFIYLYAYKLQYSNVPERLYIFNMVSEFLYF